MNILLEKPKEQLKDFLANYNSIKPIDILKANNLIDQIIRYYKGNNKERDKLKYLQYLENRWYKGLEMDKVDYSIYDDDYYFTDLWACWIIYSRNYLKGIIRNNSLSKNKSIYSILNNIDIIIDLGCGIGYTTAVLKQIFPIARVYGTNIKDTEQYNFCEYMSDRHNFNIIPDISSLNNIDTQNLVFASEYFEHIERPLEHLIDIIYRLKPRYFIIANAFNTRSVGHFINYIDNWRVINQKDISKEFNEVLVSSGYKKIKTKLWNNRPAIWVKSDIYES